MSTSWIIRRKADFIVIFETFDPRVVAALNTERYEAVPILEYLSETNKQIRSLQSGGVDSGHTKAGNKTGAAPVEEKRTPAPRLVGEFEGEAPPSTSRRSDARPALQTAR